MTDLVDFDWRYWSWLRITYWSGSLAFFQVSHPNHSDRMIELGIRLVAGGTGKHNNNSATNSHRREERGHRCVSCSKHSLDQWSWHSTMTAPLDVFRLHSNYVGVWIASAGSLLEALKVICNKGCGEYIVYSQKTERRRFYEVNGDGKIVFWEHEELGNQNRSKLRAR